MLYREIIAVCSQVHTKHVNTLWNCWMLNRIMQTGCPVSSASQGKALAKRMLILMYLLLQAQTDTTLSSLVAARAASLRPSTLGGRVWGPEVRGSWWPLCWSLAPNPLPMEELHQKRFALSQRDGAVYDTDVSLCMEFHPRTLPTQ